MSYHIGARSFRFLFCSVCFSVFCQEKNKEESRKKSLPVDSTIPHICTSTESWDTQTHIYLVMYNKTAETGCDLWWQKRVISITTETWERKKNLYIFFCVLWEKWQYNNNIHSSEWKKKKKFRNSETIFFL